MPVPTAIKAPTCTIQQAFPPSTTDKLFTTSLSLCIPVGNTQEPHPLQAASVSYNSTS